MSEPSKRPSDSQENRPSYTPASPVKRALAWMGVVYMVILVLLTTYNMATGEPLHGIPGILLFPACGGLAAVAFLRWRDVRKTPMLVLGILAALACLVNLVTGLVALATALGGN